MPGAIRINFNVQTRSAPISHARPMASDLLAAQIARREFARSHENRAHSGRSSLWIIAPITILLGCITALILRCLCCGSSSRRTSNNTTAANRPRPIFISSEEQRRRNNEDGGRFFKNVIADHARSLSLEECVQFEDKLIMCDPEAVYTLARLGVLKPIQGDAVTECSTIYFMKSYLVQRRLSPRKHLASLPMLQNAFRALPENLRNDVAAKIDKDGGPLVNPAENAEGQLASSVARKLWQDIRDLASFMIQGDQNFIVCLQGGIQSYLTERPGQEN